MADRFQNTSPGTSPKRKPRPIANPNTKTSLWFKSTIRLLSSLSPNHIIDHNLMKKIGRNTKKRGAKATASPGIEGTKATKNTYFAQNKDEPGNPIVTNTAKIDVTHNSGADKAMPPM